MSKILSMREDTFRRFPAKVAERWRRQDYNPYFLGLALCGEAGELANMLKKDWRDCPGKYNKEAIRDELADIRVYLELLAKCYEIEGDKLDEQVRRKFNYLVVKVNAEAAVESIIR